MHCVIVQVCYIIYLACVRWLLARVFFRVSELTTCEQRRANGSSVASIALTTCEVYGENIIMMMCFYINQ